MPETSSIPESSGTGIFPVLPFKNLQDARGEALREKYGRNHRRYDPFVQYIEEETGQTGEPRQLELIGIGIATEVKISVDRNIPQEVLQFLRQNDGISYFLEIKDIISDVFPKITGFETRLQNDPEVENTQWICIDIAMDAEIEEALQQYDAFTERFVNEIPSEKRELFRIGIDIG